MTGILLYFARKGFKHSMKLENKKLLQDAKHKALFPALSKVHAILKGNDANIVNEQFTVLIRICRVYIYTSCI